MNFLVFGFLKVFGLMFFEDRMFCGFYVRLGGLFMFEKFVGLLELCFNVMLLFFFLKLVFFRKFFVLLFLNKLFFNLLENVVFL